MEQKQGNMQQMLDELQADYGKAACVRFPALGWVVHMTAEGPDLYRAWLVNTEGTELARDKFNTQALGAYISATLMVEERRAAVLSAMVVAEAEKLLSA